MRHVIHALRKSRPFHSYTILRGFRQSSTLLGTYQGPR